MRRPRRVRRPGGRATSLAARTSVNGPTGPDRRVDAAAVPLGALLAARGERPRSLVVSVPATSRAAGDRPVGNADCVLPVAVPTGLDLAARVAERLAAVAGEQSRTW